ncbi:YlxR family protein [Microbacterium halophytorum]|uniref:YlxR family protein n=1 Tax=Microbacterium halophytorum TaxID=2067568 RepID=UPI000CFC1D6E|nr:YlxR family protein [Microbacterium halophytorum]
MDAVRTCVGCRARAPRDSLIRVVAVGADLVFDEAASMPGRGAWVHPAQKCVRNALQRRAFARALRVPAQVGTQTIEEWLTSYGNQVNGSK